MFLFCCSPFVYRLSELCHTSVSDESWAVFTERSHELIRPMHLGGSMRGSATWCGLSILQQRPRNKGCVLRRSTRIQSGIRMWMMRGAGCPLDYWPSSSPWAALPSSAWSQRLPGLDAGGAMERLDGWLCRLARRWLVAKVGECGSSGHGTILSICRDSPSPMERCLIRKISHQRRLRSRRWYEGMVGHWPRIHDAFWRMRCHLWRLIGWGRNWLHLPIRTSQYGHQ